MLIMVHKITITGKPAYLAGRLKLKHDLRPSPGPGQLPLFTHSSRAHKKVSEFDFASDHDLVKREGGEEERVVASSVARLLKGWKMVRMFHVLNAEVQCSVLCVTTMCQLYQSSTAKI